MADGAPGQRSTSVWWLFLGEMVMFAGIAAIFPVLPLYVRHHGGSSTVIAIFVATPMLARTILQVPAGYLCDRVGRRPLLIGAPAGFAVLSAALFLDRGPLWFLAILRTGQGAANGLYLPALRTTLTDVTPREQRGKRFAQLQAIDMAGLFVGPAVGGALALWRDSAIFGGSALGAAIGTVALLHVPETRDHAALAEAKGQVVTGWWKTSGVVVGCLALSAAGVIINMYDVVWPQYLSARGAGVVGFLAAALCAAALPAYTHDVEEVNGDFAAAANVLDVRR